MSNYQDRLCAEIERVGITILSKKLGIARNTLYNWSEKANVPLDKLMAMGEHGVDVEYVILGRVNPNVQYSEQEQKIMQNVHGLNDTDKETVERLLKGLSLVNHGHVNQGLHIGDVHFGKK